MTTEQRNPKTRDIDQLSTAQILARINDEDATVAAAVREALPDIARAVDGIVERMRRGGRLIYVGAGTSGRLGVLDAVECVPTYNTRPGQVIGVIAGGNAALTTSIEGAEDDPKQARTDLEAIGLAEADVVVGIAASGQTPYVLGAVEMAREVGALTVGVACNRPSPLLEQVEHPIGVVVGPEVVAGSTRMKAGTAQKLVLNMLSTATMIKLGKVYSNLMVDMQVTNKKLQGRATRLVALLADVSEAEAETLLRGAGQDVKVAVVMQRKGVSVEEARALLDAAEGRLRDVIGDVL